MKTFSFIKTNRVIFGVYFLICAFVIYLMIVFNIDLSNIKWVYKNFNKENLFLFYTLRFNSNLYFIINYYFIIFIVLIFPVVITSLFEKNVLKSYLINPVSRKTFYLTVLNSIFISVLIFYFLLFLVYITGILYIYFKYKPQLFYIKKAISVFLYLFTLSFLKVMFFLTFMMFLSLLLKKSIPIISITIIIYIFSLSPYIKFIKKNIDKPFINFIKPISLTYIKFFIYDTYLGSGNYESLVHACQNNIISSSGLYEMFKPDFYSLINFYPFFATIIFIVLILILQIKYFEIIDL